MNSKPMHQVMAHLPSDRVNGPEKPFINTALDYAGPINIKTSKLRTAPSIKTYIAIFVCMLSKAMHIELVSDLTAKAFIAALSRFVSRRGVVNKIYSDNATCFVSANKMLELETEMEKQEYNNTIFSNLKQQNISWHFSPPAGPHHNGLAEAAVKSVKKHLYRCIGDAKLTFEELQTLLCQIEAAVNSRPICALSTDPNDVTALTPGHFLVGSPLLSLPEENYEEHKMNWLDRWQLIQKMQQSFWRRWRDEYLSELQQKIKWFRNQPDININDLVLIREENSPATRWPLARILEKHPGSDGITRVVTVKTENNTMKRPITKISPLPINAKSMPTSMSQLCTVRKRKTKSNFFFYRSLQQC